MRDGDSLFSRPGRDVLPGSLIGVRPARHLLLWEGYFQAARVLVSEVRREPRQALRLVYPILFAYRHAIEVALKFVINFYGDEDAKPRHRLTELWERARAIVDWSCFPDDGDLRAMDAVVAELNAADRTSTAFRYAWPRRPLTEAELESDLRPLDREDVPLDLATVADVMARVEMFLKEMYFRLIDTLEDPRD